MIERILGIDLGIDLGIASLGWAVIEHDKENDANNKIVDCGVRLFTAAETPKDHKSLNEARREARGIRRVIKRRRVRMNEIKNLCIANGLLNKKDFDIDEGIYNSKANRTDVWKLRLDALHRPLEGNELARVLIHIAKHRGYDFQTEEGDAGKVKSAGEELKKKFAEAGCKTVGEYLWLHPNTNSERSVRRNKKDDYTISIHRDLLKAEIDEIFDVQTKLGNLLTTNALKEEYKNIAFFVRPMQSIKEMVGYCTFFPKDERKKLEGEKRAPKASPTAERFVALGKFFSTVIIDNQGIERKIIELKNVDELMQFAISKESLTYKQLRDFSTLFKGLSYKSKKSETTEWEKVIKETENKPWISLKGHATFKKALGDDVF
jgi:CRISPR-associated endonuclease Csn1